MARDAPAGQAEHLVSGGAKGLLDHDVRPRRPAVIRTGTGGDRSASQAVRGGFQTYGVAVVTASKPRRRRMGALSSEASTCRYVTPRADARAARVATRAR